MLIYSLVIGKLASSPMEGNANQRQHKFDQENDIKYLPTVLIDNPETKSSCREARIMCVLSILSVV